MVELSLMASHGYPPGPGLVFCQEQTKVFKGVVKCSGNSPGPAAKKLQDCLKFVSHSMTHFGGTMSGTTFFYIVEQHLGIHTGVLVLLADTCPDSVLFSFGIAEQCKHEKILKFLMSRSSQIEKGGLDSSLLSDLMGLQALTLHEHQQPCASLVYPSGKCDAAKPLVDFVGDMALSSKITVHPRGRVLFIGSGSEMKDILSIVAEFYLTKNSAKWTKQSVLLPNLSVFYQHNGFDDYFQPDTMKHKLIFLVSPLTVKDVTAAPLKRSKIETIRFSCFMQ
ncbi:hypothetical protein GH714_024498 [Hevea brasiliensis]|uniref:Uncharacterized protein n=1 Tax=Hevea brasiliensis TaxID=3981 RepID=A0A6A6LB54_HEVBR|nr:hypothetical protein GH714_024498 [Hevea brasiliensis]